MEQEKDQNSNMGALNGHCLPLQHPKRLRGGNPDWIPFFFYRTSERCGYSKLLAKEYSKNGINVSNGGLPIFPWKT